MKHFSRRSFDHFTLIAGLVAMVAIVAVFAARSAAAQYDLSLLNKGHVFTIASILEDVDEDGDLDIVISRRPETGIPGGLEWLENDGTGQFPRHELYTDETLIRPGDVVSCDCDGDGDLDYVISDRGMGVASQGQLYWIQLQDDGSFIKWTLEAGPEFEQAAVADLDDDGDLDIVAVGFTQSAVNMYLNDGSQNFSKQEIATGIQQSSYVIAEDLDGDGDVDVVFDGPDAKILWNDGSAAFDAGPLFTTGTDNATSIRRGMIVADVNDDGVPDVLGFRGSGFGGLYLFDGANDHASTLIDREGIDIGGGLAVADFDDNGLPDIVRQNTGDDILTILYQDEPMQFRRAELDYNWDNRGGSKMAVGDLDNDGDPDLVFPENGNVDGDLSWFENIDGVLHRHQLHMALRGIRSPKLADLDDDGDLDVVAAVTDDIATENEIIWFENRGVTGFIEWRIADTLDYPADIEVADLDGDGALDVIATARDDHDLIWFRMDGLVWERRAIEENASQPRGIAAADIDSDGDVDVALTSFADSKVYWYENDGAGNFTRRVVDANLSQPFEVEAADLDDDGDMDIIVISEDVANAVVTYMNDGEESFTREIQQTDYAASDVEVGDWNGTGAADILVSSRQNSSADFDVVLLSNDGDGAFTASTLVTDNRNVTALRLADTDDDGDIDLLVGNDNVTPRMRVYFNDGGAATIGVELLLDDPATIEGLDTGDVNGDGSLDFVAADSEGRNLMLFLGEGGTVDVEPISGEIPAEFSLAQNYPNPFNPVTTITFALARPSYVSLKIFDVQGREVQTLVSGAYPAGHFETRWDAAGFAAGVYVYRLQAEGFSESRVLALLK